MLLGATVDAFRRLTGGLARHQILAGNETYVQPHVYLETHLVEMWAAGWADADFDTLAVVSGASALFAYQADDFLAKYAFAVVDPDERIARATGFGYEWVRFDGAEGAWEAVRETVASGRPAKGWDWEARLMVGWDEGERAGGRRVFVLTDGPQTSAEWHSWAHFGEWVERVTQWGSNHIGRHSGTVARLPAPEVAVLAIRQLVDWGTSPPEVVVQRYPSAVFGLDGIAACAQACAEGRLTGAWLACHALNPQWTMRNSSGAYLERVADSGLLGERAAPDLRRAAACYRAAFAEWREFYALHGHDVADEDRARPERRAAGARIILRWLEWEREAIGHLQRGLSVAETPQATGSSGPAPRQGG